MKSKAILAVLLAIAALSAGCNTVSGAGKDIERGGEKIQGAADRHNN
ncbi:entericidin A/B family lipoprotein [Bordetella bronchialis]|uniref:Entericidin n=1 Tax=Bordetella bronchialis TaxID=463025 RepID=A0A193FV22_9BORD|nr:entericidin A/B family lipoprotein [Bordetella bronchialis]ANN66405.1 entericidin [Bordetella bronchialis]ANN71485.1 entericidin [Bordetella bronchialis]